jgi:S-adenosylmethionine hydrolase
VIVVDNFGNLSTNLTGADLAGMEKVVVHIAGREINGLVKTFGDRQPGELVALLGEADDLTISIVNGNAAGTLGVGTGELVEISSA